MTTRRHMLLAGLMSGLLLAPVLAHAQDDLPTLDDYWAEGDYEATVAELEDTGVIPTGGELLFQDALRSTATHAGIDAADYDLGRDVVMGAVVSVRQFDEDEVPLCAFATRLTHPADDDDGIATYLMVGVTSENELLVLQGNLDDETYENETFELEADFYSPNHLMMVVQDDVLAVFVNGEPVVEGFELEGDFIPAAGTTVGTGTQFDTSCVMTDVFAYGLPDGASTDADGEAESSNRANLGN